MLTVLITAGPTREKIDPVRFISNYSTGTFGYEIARQAAKRRGVRVILISGPTTLPAPRHVRLIQVESAKEMAGAVKREAKRSDLVIMAAAVSDWRARSPKKSKTKRRGHAHKTLELVENPDILRSLGHRKGRVLVGFALETGNLERNALKKLKEKNLDFIVANRLTPKKTVFGPGRTNIMMIDRSGDRTVLRGCTKKELAKIILDKAFNINI